MDGDQSSRHTPCAVISDESPHRAATQNTLPSPVGAASCGANLFRKPICAVNA